MRMIERSDRSAGCFISRPNAPRYISMEGTLRGVRDMDRFGLFMLETGAAVGVTVGLTIGLIQLVVGRIRGRPFSRSAGPPASLAWALGFALATFAAVGVMSIGILVLPFAVIVCGVAAWRCRALPEGAIGASLGTGFVLGVIGLMNPNHPEPCVRSITLRAGEQAHLSCGGVNGTSWLPAALALVVVAFAGQILLQRRKGEGAHSLGAPSPT
jgi:hypothetical protein